MFRLAVSITGWFVSKIMGKYAVDLHVLKLIPLADMPFSGAFECHANFL